MARCGKNAFLDQSSAVNGAKRALAMPQARGLRGLWVYQCPTCGYWHLTRRGQRDMGHFVSRFAIGEKPQ